MKTEAMKFDRWIARWEGEGGAIPQVMSARQRSSHPRIAPKDEARLAERLVSPGVEEAAHDQMVEAAKEDQAHEG